MPPTPATIEFVKSLNQQFRLPDHALWEAMSLDDCHALIQKLRACYEEGATVLNQRVYDAQRKENKYRCMVCGRLKPMSIQDRPNYVWRDDRQDPLTHVWTPRIICSSECYHRGSNSGRLTNRGVPATLNESKPPDNEVKA